MLHFNCLYYFTSAETTILEIKRLDLPSGAALGDIYKWLVVDQRTNKVCELQFKSMSQTEQQEERIFKEGEFHFNHQEGRLKFLGRDYLLSRENQERVPEELKALIAEYLL
jgi:hypothetical protein